MERSRICLMHVASSSSQNSNYKIQADSSRLSSLCVPICKSITVKQNSYGKLQEPTSMQSHKPKFKRKCSARNIWESTQGKDWFYLGQTIFLRQAKLVLIYAVRSCHRFCIAFVVNRNLRKQSPGILTANPMWAPWLHWREHPAHLLQSATFRNPSHEINLAAMCRRFTVTAPHCSSHLPTSTTTSKATGFSSIVQCILLGPQHTRLGSGTIMQRHSSIWLPHRHKRCVFATN